MLLSPSTIVRARARRFVVLEIAEHGECRSVRLSPLASDGPPLTLLQPFDQVTRLPAAGRPKSASRRRVMRCTAAAVRASHAAGETRTAASAQIQALPYQFEPALAVLQGDASRILLADEVGLGKTVQAGLILSELRARQALRRALVLTPAGLRDQWAAELRERFQLEVAVVDAGNLAIAERQLPPWVNPWSAPGVAIASIDLVKRREVLAQLEYVIWDAVVVDEAHHASPGTDRSAAASLTCARARVVVLITATPHSGDRPAFEHLTTLGWLADEGPIAIFRRTRADVWSDVPARRTRIVRVTRASAEQRLDRALRRYTARVWRESESRAARIAGARLAMVVLRKRAVSGPASLARSLMRRLAYLDRNQAGVSETQLSLEFQDTLEGDLIEDDGEPAAELAAPGLKDRATERTLLENLLERARVATSSDSKAERLVEAVTAAGEPVIVFTEYRDTLEDLRRRLDGSASVALLHGAMLPSERRASIAAFEGGRARVLLATDAAAEGLNLHRRCRWVIHHEVPWSPVRIEQRNGRVDRLGQARRVHVWHLIAATTEEEDVLARLARRSAAAARDLENEDAIARAVFDRTALALGGFHPQRTILPERAIAEAARVMLLRRLPPGSTAIDPLRDRRLSRGNRVVAVFRVIVFDSHARVVSNECIGLQGLSLDACERAAHDLAATRARESIETDGRWTRASRQRRDAIQTALLASGDEPVQVSLFNRRAIGRAEHRQADLQCARGELSDAPHSPPGYTVRTSLVAVWSASRRR